MDGETSSMDESVIRGSHSCMKKPHPWMKVSSVNVIYGWRTLIHGLQSRMMMTDDRHGRSQILVLIEVKFAPELKVC